MKRRARVIAASLAPVKRFGLLALVFVFALQAYFVQTHIHAQITAPLFKMAAAEAPGAPLPSDPLDPATCKLCREIVHAGAAITPAAPSLLLLLDWVATSIPVSQTPATAIPPESGWQSRAPPTH
jgi:hypothetical protein